MRPMLLDGEKNRADHKDMLTVQWACELFWCIGFPDADTDSTTTSPNHHWCTVLIFHDSQEHI
jgi:hypothetical protein